MDSGVGGLSIWKEIARALPAESTVYIADTKNCPYGDKSEETIFRLSSRLVSYLIKQDVKIIVIACNTITVTCLEKLRAAYPKVPIIGTVPVVKVAALMSKTKRIGILSTVNTAQSAYQQRLIREFALDCVVCNEGTNELVPFIEEGEISGKRLLAILRRVLTPFQRARIDVLVLGCSHFPFLKEQLQKQLGENTVILDSGYAIARRVAQVLLERDELAVEGKGKHLFLTTSNAGQFRSVAKNLLAGTMTKEVMIKAIDL